MNSIFSKGNWRKNFNRSGVRLASKKFSSPHVFYSKYSTYAQEAREQIDGSIS